MSAVVFLNLIVDGCETHATAFFLDFNTKNDEHAIYLFLGTAIDADQFSSGEKFYRLHFCLHLRKKKTTTECQKGSAN